MGFMKNPLLKFLLLLIIINAGSAFYLYGRSIWAPIYTKVNGTRSVEEVISRYGKASIERLMPYFNKAGVTFPPKRLTFLAMKNEKILEVWAGNSDAMTFIWRYPIRKLSGTAGPKLREGDGQVPEGIYKIVGLNPNSSYHLSMKLNYPNKFDLLHAKKENRTEPGSNIFIHGKAVSIGCLAMGDEAIEDLFVLVHKVGKSNVKVILAPNDPRKNPLIAKPTSPDWIKDLHKTIDTAFKPYDLDSVKPAQNPANTKDLQVKPTALNLSKN